MALKSSDKLIAVIGIIILIIAGIAIFLYSSPEEPTPNIVKEKTYTFTWTAFEENTTFTNYASKNKQYTGEVNINLSEGKVLTDVNFWIKWKDDYTRGILFRKGEDKLTVTISYGDDKETDKSTKQADRSIADFFINDVPDEEVYSTADENFDPTQYIFDKYSGNNTATFDLNVKVVTGEKLLTLRPLKFLNYLRDKGNKFNLIVTYNYYDFNVEEQLDNMTQSGYEDNGNIYSHLTNTGFK